MFTIRPPGILTALVGAFLALSGVASATIFVSSTANSGPNTLRQALMMPRPSP